MPDLDNRKQHEDELAALLLLLFRQYGSEALSYLTTGVRLPASFYDRLQVDANQILRDKLSQIAVESSDQLAAHLSGEEVRPQAIQASSKWAEQRAGELSKQLSDTIEEQISEATSSAEELSAEEASQSIQDSLEEIFSPERAEVNAVTNSTEAISAGEQSTARAMRKEFPDVSIRAIWRIEDASACPICLDLDGEEEEVWEIYYPNGPPAHPNCRCTLDWIVEDNIEESLVETFCPTGEGGGVDNSCGKDSSSTSSSKSPDNVFDPAKATDPTTFKWTGPAVGQTVWMLGHAHDVIAVAPYAEIKQKYPEESKEAVSFLPEGMDESKLGTAWAMKERVPRGKVWVVGSKALKLFAQAEPSKHDGMVADYGSKK